MPVAVYMRSTRSHYNSEDVQKYIHHNLQHNIIYNNIIIIHVHICNVHVYTCIIYHVHSGTQAFPVPVVNCVWVNVSITGALPQFQRIHQRAIN